MAEVAVHEGVYKCCGVVPSFGHHNYHEYKGRCGNGFGYYCSVCRRAASVIQGGNHRRFAASCWNERMTKHCQDSGVPLQLDAPHGYRCGKVTARGVYMGGSKELDMASCVFLTSTDLTKRQPYGYLSVTDLAIQIMDVHAAPVVVPLGKKLTADVGSYRTDGIDMAYLSISAVGPKYIGIVESVLGVELREHRHGFTQVL